MKSSKNLITMRTAAEYIENYARFRKNFKQKNFKPVESVQFSIEGMQDYLKYVKSLSCLRGVSVSGIRVVNAVYPSNHPDTKKRNQQTVLFIPTFRNEKGEDEAFDPLYVEDGKPMDLGELLKQAEEEEGGINQGDLEIKDTMKVMMNVIGSPTLVHQSSFHNYGAMGEKPIKV